MNAWWRIIRVSAREENRFYCDSHCRLFWVLKPPLPLLPLLRTLCWCWWICVYSRISHWWELLCASEHKISLHLWVGEEGSIELLELEIIYERSVLSWLYKSILFSSSRFAKEQWKKEEHNKSKLSCCVVWNLSIFSSWFVIMELIKNYN